jgi:hypothetical protein
MSINIAEDFPYINASKQSLVHEACFKRRASHVPNALETIDNEACQLIIYCFHEKRDI